jgi:hypothetical protein
VQTGRISAGEGRGCRTAEVPRDGKREQESGGESPRDAEAAEADGADGADLGTCRVERRAVQLGREDGDSDY